MADIDPLADRRRTAHQYVRDSLRVAILRGSLAGGTRLGQTGIARELGVSSTPVREALRDLATEGLLELRVGQGAFVRGLSVADRTDLGELLRLLEPRAARLAVAADDRSVLVGSAERLAAELDETEEPWRWAELDRAFHESLSSGLVQGRALRVLGGLRDSASPYVVRELQQRPCRRQRANVEHRQLLAAIRASDEAGAAEIAIEHVSLLLGGTDDQLSW